MSAQRKQNEDVPEQNITVVHLFYGSLIPENFIFTKNESGAMIKNTENHIPTKKPQKRAHTNKRKAYHSQNWIFDFFLAWDL